MNLKWILFLLAFVQFNHIVDFMLLMPLGPFLMRHLEIDTLQFSLLVSSYTLSAGLAGFIASFVVDRFDRRHTLLTAVGGFSLATLSCGFAESFYVLLFARSLAGLFGGVVGGQVLSIIGDLWPIEKRSSAIGTVMASFSLASVAGVPLGLLLANQWHWNAPFKILGAISIIAWIALFKFLPSINSHRENHQKSKILDTLNSVFQNSNNIKALLLMFFMMMGQFSVIPFLSPYLVQNVGLPESKIFLIYFCGGLATFFSARIIGKLADKYGRKRLYLICTLISLLPLLAITNLTPVPLAVLLTITTFFMIFISGRMIPGMSLISSTVQPSRRGGFMSLNTTVQMGTSGIAAYVSGLIITEVDGQILNYNWVGFLAISSSLIALWLSFKIREDY